jgi:C4-dicarboxylate-specific signal transduction histidine kinase
MSPRVQKSPARRAAGFDHELEEVARTLPGVLAGLRASYHELEERAARVERELGEANRDRLALSERLHAADKLSALGTMAAGIAHEIRNPLNAVRGFAELLARRPSTDARAKAWAEHIEAGVCEVDAIIENMLSFASPQRLRLERVEPRELVDGALALVEHGTATITTHVEAPPFQGDRIKLRQALRNLVENALEAQADKRAARVEAELRLDGTDLVFRVSDAGPGVPPELARKILDPFFTTHADGTGLGLALVSVIARLHGGAVQCAPGRSSLGGALFVLRIPFQPVDRPASIPHSLPH